VCYFYLLSVWHPENARSDTQKNTEKTSSKQHYYQKISKRNNASDEGERPPSQPAAKQTSDAWHGCRRSTDSRQRTAAESAILSEETS